MKSEKTKKKLINLLKNFVCIILSLVVLLPFYMVLINSVKTKNESARMSIAWPTEWHFENYLYVIEQGKLVQGFGNSMLYAVIATTVAVLSCAMVALVPHIETPFAPRP